MRIYNTNVYLIGRIFFKIFSRFFTSVRFDQTMSNNSVFYLRYVDDMLIAPNNGMEDLIRKTGKELEQRSLRVNQEKSKIVNATEGFRYLGFEIKKHKTMDELICNGNFAQAEISLNSLEPDSKDPAYFGDDFENKGQQEEQVEEQRREDNNNITADTGDDRGSDEEIPAHILSIQNNCHIINHFVNKAKQERFLSYPEKRVLLYIYKCLGDDGAKYLHTILEHCMDYNYHTTQGYIDRCKIQQPMGCKKISELFEDCCDKSGCNCNFKNEKLYPTPLIHALREKRDCFILSEASKNIGHFKKLPPKQDIHETLSKTLTLNKQIHELKTQQKICRQRLEDLFEKNGYMEIETPQGLLIKNDEGMFIKL